MPGLLTLSTLGGSLYAFFAGLSPIAIFLAGACVGSIVGAVLAAIEHDTAAFQAGIDIPYPLAIHDEQTSQIARPRRYQKEGVDQLDARPRL